jgi:hypothetical protein
MDKHSQVYTLAKGKGFGKYNGMRFAFNWDGANVRALRDIRNKGGESVKKGTTGIVTGISGRGGLIVTFDKCLDCGTVLYVRGLDYYALELASDCVETSAHEKHRTAWVVKKKHFDSDARLAEFIKQCQAEKIDAQRYRKIRDARGNIEAIAAACKWDNALMNDDFDKVIDQPFHDGKGYQAL